MTGRAQCADRLGARAVRRCASRPGVGSGSTASSSSPTGTTSRSTGNGSTLVAPTDGRGRPFPATTSAPAGLACASTWTSRTAPASRCTTSPWSARTPPGPFKPLLEGAGRPSPSRVRATSRSTTSPPAATYGDGVYIVGAQHRRARPGLHARPQRSPGRRGRRRRRTSRSSDVRSSRTSGGRRSTSSRRTARRGTSTSQDNEVRDATNFLLAAGGAGVNVGDVWLERNHVTGGRGVSVYAGQARFLRSGIHVIDNTGEGVSSGLPARAPALRALRRRRGEGQPPGGRQGRGADRCC